ncbi:MAG: CCA tRNA nucleotidyltransferase [Chloroflexi bacterium]|nr:CCA tRNA nucleotidyltransferase [Chloroflexota bacterium]
MVRPAELEEDLGRRDFTINAMALRLSGPRTGELIDLHGGERDLAAARVRILHTKSFQDDATRMFRALRYAGRLGFQIEHSTAVCLRRDRSYIDAISGTRVRRELERIAVEERVGEIIQLAFRQGVLDAVHPVLGSDGAGRKATKELTTLAVSHRDSVLLCLLLAGAAATDIEVVTGRLALTGRQAKAVSGFVALQDVLAELARPGLKASQVVDLLGPSPVESVEATALVGSRRVAGRARRYLEEWRFVRPVLHGSDLERLGIASGPKVGSMLKALLTAKLDTEVRTRDDEAAFVERVMREQRGRRRG